MRTLIALVALFFALGSNAMAADKLVKCQIGPDAHPDYKGMCQFYSEPGSFALSSPHKDKPLYGKILVVNVYITEDGAEVRGLTSRGNNSRWGEAKRSPQDKACWLGADFKVCAWTVQPDKPAEQ